MFEDVKVNFAVWGGGLVEYFPDEDRWAAHHDPDGRMGSAELKRVAKRMGVSIKVALKYSASASGMLWPEPEISTASRV